MSPRVLGFDLIRLASLIAILIFHVHSVGWYEPKLAMGPHSLIWHGLEIYARILPFSGFTVLILTCFLQGWTWKGPKKAARLIAFLLIGWVALNFLVEGDYAYFWIWDIYPLIAAGLLVAPLAPRVLGVVGLAMTWIPFWQWTSLERIPEYWRHIAIGVCANDMADWPILPWVGLVWAAFAAGREARGRRINATWIEAAIAVPVLAASTLKWGAYYSVPIDGSFGCFMFRQAPLVFWAHLLWPAYLMRLSLDTRVQGLLASFRPARWVSSLALSRHFWFAYLTHYLLINAIFLDRGEELMAYPTLCTAALLLILPVTEILTRLAIDRRLATPFPAGLEPIHDRR